MAGSSRQPLLEIARNATMLEVTDGMEKLDARMIR